MKEFADLTGKEEANDAEDLQQTLRQAYEAASRDPTIEVEDCLVGEGGMPQIVPRPVYEDDREGLVLRWMPSQDGPNGGIFEVDIEDANGADVRLPVNEGVALHLSLARFMVSRAGAALQLRDGSVIENRHFTERIRGFFSHLEFSGLVGPRAAELSEEDLENTQTIDDVLLWQLENAQLYESKDESESYIDFVSDESNTIIRGFNLAKVGGNGTWDYPIASVAVFEAFDAEPGANPCSFLLSLKMAGREGLKLIGEDGNAWEVQEVNVQVEAGRMLVFMGEDDEGDPVLLHPLAEKALERILNGLTPIPLHQEAA